VRRRKSKILKMMLKRRKHYRSKRIGGGLGLWKIMLGFGFCV
jgi:hypothetical protein